METETPLSTSPALCKHWARSKVCLYHNSGKCKFSHPADYEVPLVCPSARSRSKKNNTQKNVNKNQKQRHRSTGGRLQTRNDTRVAKMRSFIATFLDLSKCNILDVAGGKGEMAFQLLNLSNAATCHVIDPRPLSLTRFQKRLRRGFYHRSASVLGSVQDIVRQQDEPERPVGHLRCFFREELWQEEEEHPEEEKQSESKSGSGSRSTRSNHQQEFENNRQNSQKWTWPPVGADNEHANSSNCGHDDKDEKDYSIRATSAATTATATTSAITNNGLAMPQTESLTFDHASSTVKHANLIIGMHPDQAVDAIVDAALHLNISFFVVPCCTYSREFPHRRLKYIPPPRSRPHDSDGDNDNDIGNMNVNVNDKRVTTYSDLLAYLQEKSPDIQRHILPFEGKNVCLYRIV